MNFHDTTVMITGASRGLGKALALEFARVGARVSACARSAEALEEVAAGLEAVGNKYLCDSVDIADPSAVGRWVERTVSRLGHPGVLINNASVLGPRDELLEVEVDEWRRVLSTNLDGSFIVTRAVAPGMIERGAGSIINVSSGASVPPRVKWGPYAVSKAALDAFSLNLGAELEGTGVRVNVVDPGAMRTEMRADAYPDEDPGTLKEAGAIAPLFLWLAQPGAGSGQRIQADDWLRQRSSQI